MRIQCCACRLNRCTLFATGYPAEGATQARCRPPHGGLLRSGRRLVVQTIPELSLAWARLRASLKSCRYHLNSDSMPPIKAAREHPDSCSAAFSGDVPPAVPRPRSGTPQHLEDSAGRTIPIFRCGITQVRTLTSSHWNTTECRRRTSRLRLGTSAPPYLP
jgi:hypothetical protein